MMDPGGVLALALVASLGIHTEAPSNLSPAAVTELERGLTAALDRAGYTFRLDEERALCHPHCAADVRARLGVDEVLWISPKLGLTRIRVRLVLNAREAVFDASAAGFATAETLDRAVRGLGLVSRRPPPDVFTAAGPGSTGGAHLNPWVIALGATSVALLGSSILFALHADGQSDLGPPGLVEPSFVQERSDAFRLSRTVSVTCLVAGIVVGAGALYLGLSG